VRYDQAGLAPCIAQDAATREVLMVAYADAVALAATLETGEAHFWSRSRRELWHKGATSGNVLRVVCARLDCDHDAVLLEVEPAGPACHTGAVSCFRDEASGGAAVVVRPGGG
jgi:phosphoribosyl-AMP cyclohydrolase